MDDVGHHESLAAQLIWLELMLNDIKSLVDSDEKCSLYTTAYRETKCQNRFFEPLIKYVIYEYPPLALTFYSQRLPLETIPI